MNITANFTDEELGYESTPAVYRPNLLRLALLLQAVRNIVAIPMVVTSAYRDPTKNEAVNGAEGSQHLTAEAADFAIGGPIKSWEFASRIRAAINDGTMPEFGQLIYYPFTDGHVHISLPRDGKKNNEILVKLAEGGYDTFSDTVLSHFPGAGDLGESGITVLVLLVVGVLLFAAATIFRGLR